MLKAAIWTTAQFVLNTNKCHRAISIIANENGIFFPLHDETTPVFSNEQLYSM